MSVDAGSEILGATFSPAGDPQPVPSTMMVVAHPDDEVIGAGGQLRRFQSDLVVCVTDGAPADMSDAKAAGIFDRREYAARRRQEFHSALALAGLTEDRACCLGFPDQEASLNLVGLARRLIELLREFRPAAVLTHPYEGGHPDHDATALAVHAASRQIEREVERPSKIIEMTSYHNRAGRMAVGEFLPADGCPIHTVELSQEERALKRMMFDCYRTQQHVLQYFPIGVERFRLAPRYDFTRPPHPGKLFYEQFNWGMTGERFVRLACEMIDALGMRGSSCR